MMRKQLLIYHIISIHYLVIVFSIPLFSYLSPSPSPSLSFCVHAFIRVCVLTTSPPPRQEGTRGQARGRGRREWPYRPRRPLSQRRGGRGRRAVRCGSPRRTPHGPRCRRYLQKHERNTLYDLNNERNNLQKWTPEVRTRNAINICQQQISIILCKT
ncbi:hypothetical protein T492DRAFT_460543 [Pavlovales sp. CCMP2436]|nr:hypothetical protein T492DRAFT_460543 [Pavlovales sp. CCMP2436]